MHVRSTFAYCYHFLMSSVTLGSDSDDIKQLPLNYYLQYACTGTYSHSLIVIIRLMISLYLNPKVIILICFHCIIIYRNLVHSLIVIIQLMLSLYLNPRLLLPTICMKLVHSLIIITNLMLLLYHNPIV
jgi:hypothetical protein